MKSLLVGVEKTLVVTIVIPLILPLLLWLGIFKAFAAIYLRIWFWAKALSKDRHIAFAYSNSPNWHEYIETNLLPKIEDSSYLLNWSNRRDWTRSERLFLDQFLGSTGILPRRNRLCVLLAPETYTHVSGFPIPPARQG